jgi:hypothetical protein
LIPWSTLILTVNEVYNVKIQANSQEFAGSFPVSSTRYGKIEERRVGPWKAKLKGKFGWVTYIKRELYHFFEAKAAVS